MGKGGRLLKRSDLKSKIRINRLARRCMALLIVMVTVAALAWPGYDTLPTVSTANEEDTVMPLAVPEEDRNLLAWFNFEEK